MFKNIYPLFEAKRILRAKMLENLRDYPRNIFQILYQDYSDGILAGCKLEVRGNYIVIYPGILYYAKIPYILEETCEVPYEATGKLQYLKIRFLDKTEGVGQSEYLSRIFLDERKVEEGYEIELARFKLQKGARLRTEYVDFYDFHTEFDTINLIYAPYASPEKSSISPQIVTCFVETLMKLSSQNPWDYAFCMSCLQNQGSLPYKEIHAYLNVRMKQEKTEYSNQEIYHAFGQILKEAGGTDINRPKEEKKEKRWLLL